MAGDGYALRFDNVAYTAAMERLLQSSLYMPASSTRARPGIRAGGGLGVTIGTSPESAIIAAGGGVVNDTGAGQGSYAFVIPAAVTKALTARPVAGQSRIDEVVAKVLNVDERPADGTGIREVDLAVITGSPSTGTPTAPTIPTGQLRIAELLVPASGTITVQNPGQRTVALGGTLPVASQAERDAIEVIYEGLVVYREDTDVFEARANGVWERLMIAGRGGAPFAQAAGTALLSGSSVAPSGFGNVNITFPAGRFTQPPLVEVHINGFVTNTSLVVAKYADNITTTGARLNVVNAGGGTVSWTNLPVMWRAVQMTSAAAAG